ncbi:DUF2125 domain-containing protein [Thalassovita taeanensis]|uniref:DUF2125 domain-containing protein n=1 Tax=Thalassovita taeanensis TaxID=657014 RepID=A0A1H9CHS8_9RHOB|nr:DUF2125 domain-containing protein [Thalassovita taeanensis]SEQ00178.1 hypothetical protein SAMN04488092_103248 [Thalassovita taeanensis]
MKPRTAFITPTAAAIVIASGIFSGTTACADVTPQQVWESFKAPLEGVGYTVTATENSTANNLTISDLEMTFPLPEDDGTARITLGSLTFHDNHDGTVAIQMPASMPVLINSTPRKSKPFSAKLSLDTAGLVTTVSGQPDDMTYSYSAPSLGLALDQLMVDGAPVKVDQAMLSLTNLSGTSAMTKAALRTVQQSLRADGLTYVLEFTDPEGKGGHVLMQGDLTGLNSTGTSATPENFDPNDLSAALKAGLAIDVVITHTGGTTAFAFTDNEGQDTGGQTRSGSGRLSVLMNADQLSYAAAATDTSVDFQSSDLPFPVALDMAKTGFSLRIPVGKSDEPQDFALSVTLGDFTMSDVIWSLFDAGAQLPRDPATFAFDLAGKARMLVDVLNSKEMETLGDTAPGELHALTVNSLTLRLAGAELTGEGDFTFDNTDTTTFDGMPKPTGLLHLALTGGNALLDKMVAMGFIPEDQAMSTRMMMGLFAVPGDGPDSLKSTIEVNEAGHVLANGQRLK